jgi:16S rRNA (cytidine1402-2'-O)-methyltransferase
MLYIVATPIGNLSDITLRALDIIKTVRLIIAENPNHTRKLLNHYDMSGKKLLQFAEHNETKVLASLIDQLQTTDACLLTDAGTPGLADPGFRLVRACVEAGIPVSALPGPNAAISGLAASGLPTDKYIFFGFLQKTEPKILKALEEAKQVAATAIFYESPERITKTIKIIATAYPDAQVVIARELTKIHEEFIRGTAEKVHEELSQRQSVKGEMTVLVSFK